MIPAKTRPLTVVLTGGPGGGKTTGVDLLLRVLRDDYKIEAIGFSEVSSYLKAKLGISGLRSEDELIEFHRKVAQFQNSRELLDINASCATVVVLDRCVIDSAGFIKQAGYAQILEELGVAPADLFRRYDLVFFLVSVAADYPNVAARFERPSSEVFLQHVKLVENRLRMAWRGHPRIHLIDPVSVHAEKVLAIGAMISAFLELGGRE